MLKLGVYGNVSEHSPKLLSIEIRFAQDSSVDAVLLLSQLKINKNKVKFFDNSKEKSDVYVNGGFFVMKPKFLDFIQGDATVLESNPLEKVTDLKEIKAFKHEGFWQCMDTKKSLYVLW